jgi:hypothetical protein
VIIDILCDARGGKMSQLFSVLGMFGLLAAAYGCDRLVILLRMQLARTFNTTLFLPLTALVAVLFAAALLLFTLYIFRWSSRDVGTGVVLLAVGILVTAFCASPLIFRLHFVAQPGSYLTLTAAFVALTGLMSLLMPARPPALPR